MRRLALLGVLVLVATGCGGGGSPSAESVVRAWSHALNEGDNETAAKLFATGARVIQGTSRYRFRTTGDALKWNAGLPCAGRIVGIETNGDEATATFDLYERETSTCDAPGGKASAVIKVKDGKIVLFEQIAPLPYDSGTV